MQLLLARLLWSAALLGLLSRAARVPASTQRCARQALYAQATEAGSVVVTADGTFEFVPHEAQGARADLTPRTCALPSIRCRTSCTPSAPLTRSPAPAVEGAAAWGSFLDGSHTVSNFGQLRVSTSGAHSDADQVFAAGFLEGHLTAPRIHQNFKNLHSYFVHVMNASLEEPMAWISRQDAWVRSRCAEEGVDGFPQRRRPDSEEADEGDVGARRHRHRHRRRRHAHRSHRGGTGAGQDERFWAAVCLAIRQFDGVVAGYQARAADEARAAGGGRRPALPPMSAADFLFLESNGDLYDVIDWMDPSQRPSWAPGGDDPDDPGGKYGAAGARSAPSQADADRLFRRVALSGKCSALVKLAADLSDLYMGHSTWDSYTAMLRVYKHYAFNLTELAPAAQRASFSSYPGEVFSDDDFYLLDSGLVVLQTTNKVFDDSLFGALTPRSVLSWQRVRAANWLADGGAAWAAALDTHNSGTYNNQYMVVDLAKFSPGNDPLPGLLWVAEQIPGRVVAADMTPTLALGYWPSFNVPAFPEIYNASGYPDFVARLDKFGQHFSRVRRRLRQGAAGRRPRGASAGTAPSPAAAGPRARCAPSPPQSNRRETFTRRRPLPRPAPQTTHWLSYASSPRAKIFRRDHASIDSLEGIKAVMRGNAWRSDPLSEGHPIAAVCGRGDLDPTAPEARGWCAARRAPPCWAAGGRRRGAHAPCAPLAASWSSLGSPAARRPASLLRPVPRAPRPRRSYDTKVTSWRLALQLQADAVNGPTRDLGELPAFTWDDVGAPSQAPLHEGQPPRFDFEFERMAPSPSPGDVVGGCGGGGGLGGGGGALRAQQ
jgi:hypothetical protein